MFERLANHGPVSIWDRDGAEIHGAALRRAKVVLGQTTTGLCCWRATWPPLQTCAPAPPEQTTGCCWMLLPAASQQRTDELHRPRPGPRHGTEAVPAQTDRTTRGSGCDRSADEWPAEGSGAQDAGICTDRIPTTGENMHAMQPFLPYQTSPLAKVQQQRHVLHLNFDEQGPKAPAAWHGMFLSSCRTGHALRNHPPQMRPLHLLRCDVPYRPIFPTLYPRRQRPSQNLPTGITESCSQPC